jgi:hypothetical protein
MKLLASSLALELSLVLLATSLLDFCATKRAYRAFLAKFSVLGCAK